MPQLGISYELSIKNQSKIVYFNLREQLSTLVLRKSLLFFQFPSCHSSVLLSFAFMDGDREGTLKYIFLYIIIDL